jgi:hypothetical protein
VPFYARELRYTLKPGRVILVDPNREVSLLLLLGFVNPRHAVYGYCTSEVPSTNSTNEIYSTLLLCYPHLYENSTLLLDN